LKKKAEEQKELNQSEKMVKTTPVQKEEKQVDTSINTVSNDKEIKRIEKEISELESKIEAMNLVLAELDYSDESKANSILSDYEKLKSDLEQKMIDWEKLLQ
jgi:superfamily II RNA helicase